MRGSFAGASRLIIVALLFLAGTCVLAAAQAAQENQPAIIIEELVYDFGTVFEQPSYKHTFIVKNEGKADLIIKDVKPG